MNRPKQTWFITGAGRGLGVELAKAALAAGHNVVAAGRNTETVAEAIGKHDDLLVVRLDVTDAEQADAAIAAAVERFSRVDVLVNNAGNFIAGFFEEISPAQVQAQVGTLLLGTMAVTRAVLPTMRAQRAGTVGRADRLEDIVSEAGLVDITGRLRSPAATPGHWAGCAPSNQGLRYPADPPTVDEIILVMREAGPGPYADTFRALIAIQWRAGYGSAKRSLSLRPIWTRRPDRCRSAPARAGSDEWSGWTTGRGTTSSWTEHRIHLPVGPLFCILAGPTRGPGWSATAARGELRRLAAQAGRGIEIVACLRRRRCGRSGPETSGSSPASSNLLTAMRLLVVVHHATLSLDDREAAFVAMPQVAWQSRLDRGRRVSRASGDLASWSIRWWLCTASVLPRPCCSAWAGEYLGSDASERQIALPPTALSGRRLASICCG